MATKARPRFAGKARDSYLELIETFPLASIRSESQLEGAQKVVDRLLARGALDKGERMYLDALSDLVAAYEDQHHAIGPASDADMLRHLLESKGKTQAELHRETKISSSTISEILHRKRPFTRGIIRKLSAYFGVEPGVLASNL